MEKRYYMDMTTKEGVVTKWLMLNDNDVQRGDSIASLAAAIEKLPTRAKVYTDNLSFKGKFIVPCFDDKGYQYETKEFMKQKVNVGLYYNTMVSGVGIWYNINIKKGEKFISILDCDKKTPVHLEDLKKTYHVSFDEELLENTMTWQFAIEKQYANGLRSETISADAMNEFKNMFGRKRFDVFFPKLEDEVDRAIRKSYRGAFNYKNADSAGKGIVLDIKSMYPFIMSEFALPVGRPRILEGDRVRELDPDRFAQFFVITITAELKENHIPTIVDPHEDKVTNKYLEVVFDMDMTVSYYELKLIKEQYDVYNLVIHKQYLFKTSKTVFSDYIEKYFSIKENTEDVALKLIAKLMLNSLYGKFGQFIDGFRQNVKGNIVHRERIKTVNTIYVPIASYITAIGRWLIINGAQLNYEHFLYSDTDSLHLECSLDEVKTNELMKIGRELGNYDIEYRFKKAKYLKPKVYALQGENDLKTVVAGLPGDKRDTITFENFELGLVIPNGSKMTKKVENGAIEYYTDFTIN